MQDPGDTPPSRGRPTLKAGLSESTSHPALSRKELVASQIWQTLQEFSLEKMPEGFLFTSPLLICLILEDWARSGAILGIRNRTVSKEGNPTRMDLAVDQDHA